jgi:hypothetical protein
MRFYVAAVQQTSENLNASSHKAWLLHHAGQMRIRIATVPNKPRPSN